MEEFLKAHRANILGVLEGPDRLIFKGYLTKMYPRGAFGRYLFGRHCLLKEAGDFFARETERIVSSAKALAQTKGRPYLYLDSPHTHADDVSKEAMARQIAERDGIREGLVCILAVQENCSSFVVRGNRQTHRLEIVRKPRRCVHLYFYCIDPEFGWMHIRIQTWAPYGIQIYGNGREWLSRRLAEAGIRFDKSDNKILWVEDFAKAQALFDKLARRRWHTFLKRYAKMVNPLLPDIAKAGFGEYWWVTDQCEYATDILFRDRAAVDAIIGDLLKASMIALGADDVYRFLGRKPHGAFTGEVVIDHKRRPAGARVKFRIRRNAIKLYDHLNLLRVETTINNPRDFKVLRRLRGPRRETRRWCPMGKSISNFWRLRQVARAANGRLLDSLAAAPLTGEAVADLDSLCRPRAVAGRHVPRLNPVERKTVDRFAAILSGEFALNGFRNRDLQAKLYAPTADTQERRRRTHRLSRFLATLRGHGLIARVPRAHLYRLTQRGCRLLWATVRIQRHDFPLLAIPKAPAA
jgi:hypothetical protein